MKNWSRRHGCGSWAVTALRTHLLSDFEGLPSEWWFATVALTLASLSSHTPTFPWKWLEFPLRSSYSYVVFRMLRLYWPLSFDTNHLIGMFWGKVLPKTTNKTYLPAYFLYFCVIILELLPNWWVLRLWTIWGLQWQISIWPGTCSVGGETRVETSILYCKIASNTLWISCAWYYI